MQQPTTATGDFPALEKAAADPLRLEFHAPRILRRILLACIAIEISFVVLDYWVNYARGVDIGPIRRMFNITREDGLASWFAITQTFLLALTLWATVIITRRAGKRWVAWCWLVLALLFTYMAVDDGATIHERLGSTLKEVRARNDQAASAYPSYPWQIIFVPFFGVMGLFMLGFMLRQFSARWQRVAVALALAAMACAVGLDFFEGLDDDHRWNVHSAIADRFDFEGFARETFRHTEYETLVHFGKSLEETLEMFAITLLWIACLAHLMHVGRDVRVRFTTSPAGP